MVIFFPVIFVLSADETLAAGGDVPKVSATKAKALAPNILDTDVFRVDNIRRGSGPGRSLMGCAKALEIGDSFFIKKARQDDIRNNAGAWKRATGFSFKIDRAFGGVRVWRTA